MLSKGSMAACPFFFFFLGPLIRVESHGDVEAAEAMNQHDKGLRYILLCPAQVSRWILASGVKSRH